QALVTAISEAHPPTPIDVGESKLKACAKFIAQFDGLYSVSYDLLLYWSSLANGDFPFKDGFGREIDTNDAHCVFLTTSSGENYMYFLHGALYLYSKDGETYKRVWKSTKIRLIDQVRTAMD